jgi:hypothetical protein|tara:strand:- start:315 stop:500 length:186 start_codon:yes stop_codon:yes gene_type:complete
MKNKKWIKISSIKEYNNQCEDIHRTFNKNYGYVLYGYNCFNTARDFAIWFKTKKEATNNIR